MDGLPVTVAGTGRTTRNEPASDFILRFVQFETIASESCLSYTKFERPPKTILCGFGNSTTHQAAHKGDSGE